MKRFIREPVQKMLSVLRELAQQMRNEAIAIESLLKDSIRTWTEWRDTLQAQVRDLSRHNHC